jgi:transposase
VHDKVELFERIRGDHARHGWSIRALARRHACHRRDVRGALRSAEPPPRKERLYSQPVLDPWKPAIDAMLEADRTAPRKQRHTAHRVWTRLTAEQGAAVSERTVRAYVRGRRRELGGVREVMVPQHHEPGAVAEVDLGESWVRFPGGLEKVDLFTMRACASGAAFHWPVRALTQQAFLEAHVEAFAAFGGVFATVRYDNLKLAVRRILRGRARLETRNFVLLRSHYGFEAVFCRPGLVGAHEKGGVEGEIGYHRRNALVPVPGVGSWAELIERCRQAARDEQSRQLAGSPVSVGAAWAAEQPRLRPLPVEPFDPRVHVSGRLDPKSRLTVLRNRYSAPVTLAGGTAAAVVSSTTVVIRHGGREVARHPRVYGIGHDRLVLDHYLEVLRYKPGALAGSVPLRQAIATGTFPPAYVELFRRLRDRHGESEGARQMVDVLFLHRDHGLPTVLMAVEAALATGAYEAAAVALQVRSATEPPALRTALPPLRVLHQPTVPVPTVAAYDQLLHPRDQGDPA